MVCAHAGIIAAPTARVLQGPSSSATIVGPDGSSISSVAPGGTVVADAAPAVIAAAPLVRSDVVTPGAWAVPAALAAAPVVRSGVWASPAALAAPGLVARSTVLTGLGETVIAGPAGTIRASGNLIGAPLGAVWA